MFENAYQWSLLHFILPDIFQDLQTFQTWFDFDEQLHCDGGMCDAVSCCVLQRVDV